MKKFYTSKIILFNSLVIATATALYFQDHSQGAINYEALAASLVSSINIVLRFFTNTAVK